VAASALGSILLGTTHPVRLRNWYAAAFAGGDDDGFTEVSPTLFACRFGDTSLLIDGRGDVADSNPDPGRVVLNFHVDDVRAMVERLDALGVTWLVELEERDGGLFGTLVDPDGNYVQIIELREERGAS
jgi:uncharacterized glyoxalase superfamily protein PhnB